MPRRYLPLFASLLLLSFLPLNVIAFPGQTEISTSATLKIDPQIIELGQTAEISMLIEPLPLPQFDRFNGMLITVTQPNGKSETMGPFQTNTVGSAKTVYIPNTTGVFTFQLFHPEEVSSDGSIVYKTTTSALTPLQVVNELVKPNPNLPPSAEPVIGALPIENSWSKKASLQQARGSLGVAVVNEKIYAIGGSNASALYPGNLKSGYVRTNEEYDPTTNTWTYKSPMPTPRAEFAIAVYDGKIYCIGGVIGMHPVPWEGSSLMTSDFTLTAVNEVYDPLADTWETKTSAPEAGMMMKAIVFKDKIYMADGDLTEVYDPKSDSWTAVANSPLGKYDFGPGGGNDYQLIVFSDKLHIVGGLSKGSLVERKLFAVYNEVNDTWIDETSLPAAEYYDLAASSTNGLVAPWRLYVLLGIRGLIPTMANYVYDPISDIWVTAKSPPTTRMEFGFVTLHDKLYAVGGYTIFSGKVTPSSLNEEYIPIGYGKPDLPTEPQNDSYEMPRESQIPVAQSDAHTQSFPVNTITIACLSIIVAIITLVFMLRIKARKSLRT